MTLKTSTLIGSAIVLPLLTQAVDIIGYNTADCTAGEHGVMFRCNDVQPAECCSFPVTQAPDTIYHGRRVKAWYTYGSVGIRGLDKNLDTHSDLSYWTRGPESDCWGEIIGNIQNTGETRCHTRDIGTGEMSEKTVDDNDIFIAGGAQYIHRPRPRVTPGNGPSDDQAGGGPGRRRFRRVNDQTAEHTKKERCPADGGCKKRKIPTVYVYPEDKTSNHVWVLDPLPEHKFDSVMQKVRSGNQSEIDIVQDYKARWVQDKSQEPGLKANQTT